MTMDREDLKAYIDGELPAQKSAEIREIVEKDGELAQQVAFLKLLGEGIREVSKDPPVLGATAMLGLIRRPQAVRWPMYAFGSAAVVMALVAIPSLIHQSGSSADSASYVGTVADNATAASAKAANPTPNDILGSLDSLKEARSNSSHEAGSFGSAGGSFGSAGGRAKSAAANAKAPMTIPNSPYTNSLSKADSGRPSSETAYFLSPKQKARSFKSNEADMGGFEESRAQHSLPRQSVQDNRMVVQNGTMEEVVKDVVAAEDDVATYTKGLGGFVQSSSLNKSDSDLPEATLTLRVPVQNFNQAINHLKSLATDSAHIKSLQISGDDVTGQYADASARLNEMGAEEDSYVTMLRGARHLDDVLEIKDRLSQVRQNIESLKAQTATLKDTSTLSTIELTLDQVAKSQPQVKPPAQTPQASWSGSAWSSASDGLRSAAQAIATVGIFAFVYSPIWVPLGLIGYWVYRKTR